MKIAAALLLTQMQVSGLPVATIGVVDGDTLQTLSNVTAAQEDRRGNLYVVQPRMPFIAVFDSLGERIATLGRRGQGPGEFTWATHVTVLRDSIYVSGSGKIAVYSPDFHHVRDILTNTEYPGLQKLQPTARYRVTYVTETGFLADLGTQDKRWIAFQPWNGLPMILDEYELTDVAVNVVIGQNTFRGIQSPLPQEPLVLPTAGTLYLFRRQPTPTLREFTLAGWGPTQAVQLEMTPVPASLEEEWAKGFVDQWDPDQLPVPPAQMREALEEAYTSPERSAFATLRVGGPDGDIWLEQKVPGEPVRMVQINVTGEVLNTFDVPERATVLSIRAGSVWLLELDQYDVPFLRRYRLVR